MIVILGFAIVWNLFFLKDFLKLQDYFESSTFLRESEFQLKFQIILLLSLQYSFIYCSFTPHFYKEFWPIDDKKSMAGGKKLIAFFLSFPRIDTGGKRSLSSQMIEDVKKTLKLFFLNKI